MMSWNCDWLCLGQSLFMNPICCTRLTCDNVRNSEFFHLFVHKAICFIRIQQHRLCSWEQKALEHLEWTGFVLSIEQNCVCAFVSLYVGCAKWSTKFCNNMRFAGERENECTIYLFYMPKLANKMESFRKLCICYRHFVVLHGTSGNFFCIQNVHGYDY